MKNTRGRGRGKYGEGSFRLLDNTHWEYRITYVNEYGVRKSKSFTSETQDECLARAQAFKEKREKFLAGIDVDATIPSLVTAKIEDDLAKGYTGIQGYDRNLSTIEIIRKSHIGSIPIADVTERDLNLFLQSITRYSNNTLRKVYSMLKSAYSIAENEALVDKNLMTARSLRCPKSKKPDKVVRGMTEEEQRKFLAALSEYKVAKGGNDYRNQLYIELYAGLRMGEINALKPEDIVFDGEGGVIKVYKTISRGENCCSFLKEGTKTDAGVREVPISKPLVPILKNALANCNTRKSKGLLFYDHRKHGIIETNQVNSFFRRICQKAGIPYYGQHALRHTYATRCIESGVDPVVLKTWLGHTDIHITLDTYADVFNRMHSNAIDQLNVYMEDVLKLGSDALVTSKAGS